MAMLWSICVKTFYLNCIWERKDQNTGMYNIQCTIYISNICNSFVTKHEIQFQVWLSQARVPGFLFTRRAAPPAAGSTSRSHCGAWRRVSPGTRWVTCHVSRVMCHERRCRLISSITECKQCMGAQDGCMGWSQAGPPWRLWQAELWGWHPTGRTMLLTIHHLNTGFLNCDELHDFNIFKCSPAFLYV